MQYLNDDNMDELFRRAADDYPLNTNSKNWDKVMAALQNENTDATSNKNAAKKNNFRKYLWLLLLLPMAWICNGKFFMNDSKQGEDNVIIKSAEQPKTTSEAKTKNFDSKSTQLSNTQKSASQKNSIASKTESSIKNSLPPQPSTSTLTDNSKTTTVQTIRQTQKIKITNSKSGRLLTLNDNNLTKKNKSAFSENKKNKSLNAIADNEDNAERDETKTNVAAEDKTTKVTAETKNDATDKNITDEPNKAQSSLDITKPVNSEKIDFTNKQVVQQSTKKSSTEKNKTHFLYAGIIGGFDVSTVKFQSVKSTGYTAGALLGYQLTKKLSIESGFLLDKKFYYTDGKDFSTKKIYIIQNTSILNATGSCYMFEWPINVKYNWTSTQKSNWFSTLGVSSYFMKKENYDFTVESSGITWPTGWESYNNSSVNWFGVINLSGGYMHTLGKAGSLRVEPYLKIPVQGLGIGSLSVWSTGIYVSFIKKIF
jgi:hypothetical protein